VGRRFRVLLSGSIAACGMASASVAFAGQPALACDPPLKPMQQIELMFGRSVHGHPAADHVAWTRFLAHEITPRFPDGLTVIDAAGQWRDPSSRRIAHEPSRLVIIVTAGDVSLDGKIAAIVAAYRQRFRQKSVGVVTSAVCAAF
jgi:hypothetical protein